MLTSKHLNNSSPYAPIDCRGTSFISGPNFIVNIYVDVSYVGKSCLRLGYHHVNYGALISLAVEELAKRLGWHSPSGRAEFNNTLAKHTDRSINTLSKTIWGFASVPINYHPDDHYAVRKYRGFLTALRRQHGFIIKEWSTNYHRYHLRAGERRLSPDPKERNWLQREKGVDTIMSLSLVQGCSAWSSPSAIIAVTGDADFAPALCRIKQKGPHRAVMVAGFYHSLSRAYYPNNPYGIRWDWPPIILDRFITLLHKRSKLPTDGEK